MRAQLGFLRQNAADNSGGRHGQCTGGGKRPVEQLPIAIKIPIIEHMVTMTCKPPKPNTGGALALRFRQEEFETDAEHKADFAQIVGSVALPESI